MDTTKESFESDKFSAKKRIKTGILIGILLFFLAVGVYAAAMLMVSVMVMGCQKSPPEWVFEIVFIGFPLPLIFSSILTPYLYIKKLHKFWIFLSITLGIFLSCMIFFIWFLILTRYC